MSTYYTDDELAAALERSQVTFLPIYNPFHDDYYIRVLAPATSSLCSPSGDLMGRIYHCERTNKFEVLDLGDTIVAVVDDDDTIMLAAEVMTQLAGARRDAGFVNFSALVDSVDIAFGERFGAAAESAIRDEA